MTTWWAMPAYQQETCWTTSLRPMATSQQLTWRSTSSTCAEPGIPNSQWRLSSSRFKTVLTIRRRGGGVPIGPSQQINVGYAKIFATGHFMSACQRWNEKPAAEKLGLTSNPTSQPLTVSTSKCRENPLQTPDTTQLTPP
jgi:hypothetical protein